MAIYMTARFEVRPEARAVCERAIRDFVEYVRLNEPQTRLYMSVQESADARRFLHFFIFETESAREAHSSSEAVKRFTDVLYPACTAPVEFTEYTLVASTSE